MEELFAIVVVVIGVIVKLVEAYNKRRSADPAGKVPEFDEPENWQEVFGFPLEEVPKVKPIFPAGKMPDTSTSVNNTFENNAWNQRILEEQQRYAELAAQAEKANKASIAGESSVIYTSEDNGCECHNSVKASDWAELIRNNRREALIMSEILSPPSALRK